MIISILLIFKPIIIDVCVKCLDSVFMASSIIYCGLENGVHQEKYFVTNNIVEVGFEGPELV